MLAASSCFESHVIIQKGGLPSLFIWTQKADCYDNLSVWSSFKTEMKETLLIRFDFSCFLKISDSVDESARVDRHLCYRLAAGSTQTDTSIVSYSWQVDNRIRQKLC